MVLFVRIGAFQWVTREKVKKIDSRLRLCAKRLKRILSLICPLRRPARAGLNPATKKISNQLSDFCKKMSAGVIFTSRSSSGPASERSHLRVASARSSDLRPKLNPLDRFRPPFAVLSDQPLRAERRHMLVGLSNQPHVRPRKFSLVGVLIHCLNRVMVT